MLISGGIGITPMESIYEHLVCEIHAGQRDLRRIKFIWVEREPTFVEKKGGILTEKAIPRSTGEFSTRNDSLTRSCSGGFDVDEDFVEDVGPGSIDNKLDIDKVLASDVTLPLQSSIAGFDVDAHYCDDNRNADIEQIITKALTSKDQLFLQALSGRVDVDGDEEVGSGNNHSTGKQEIDKFLDNPDNFPKGKDIKLGIDVDADEGEGKVQNREEYVLDLEIYLSSSKPESKTRLDPSSKSTRFGRPNIPEIFLRMKREVLMESFASLSEGTNLTVENTNIGRHHIAVCISAPQSLTNACRRACLMYSDDNVKFDVHYEIMTG
jgi:Ferric reductase NAD binding domain